MSTLLYNYFFYYPIKDFKKESKLLFLIMNRLGIYKDVSLYICRHLGSLHRILPHPLVCPQVESIVFHMIDRGIYDYKEFSLFLKKFFPNIERLSLCQKYSNPIKEDISYFIKTLGLKQLFVIDSCGEYWLTIDWKDILSDMPNNSEYRLTLFFEHGEGSNLIFEDSESSKKLKIWKHGDYKCNDIYDRYNDICYRII